MGRIIFCHVHLYQAAKAEDRGEYIVEVMGDTSRKLAYRLHLLGLAQLRLQLPVLSDVANVALNNLDFVNQVDITDKLYLDLSSILCGQGEIIVADIFFFL
jgi:hypothetical protein